MIGANTAFEMSAKNKPNLIDAKSLLTTDTYAKISAFVESAIKTETLKGGFELSIMDDEISQAGGLERKIGEFYGSAPIPRKWFVALKTDLEANGYAVERFFATSFNPQNGWGLRINWFPSNYAEQ